MKSSGVPVIVRNVKPARTDERILQVEFYQDIPVPVVDRNSLLNMLMKGHQSFGPTSRVRVAYQNMYVDAYKGFGLDIDKSFPTEWGAEIVIHEFCDGDVLPENVRSFYGGVEHYTPKSWVTWIDDKPVKCYQKAKCTPNIEGKGEITLMRNGNPIYRNTFFTVNTMFQDDILIKHDPINSEFKGFNQNMSSKCNINQVGGAVLH